MLRALLGFLWRQLPDRCEMPHCSRHGVRGNENMVPVGTGEKRKWRLMCDECTQIDLMQWRGQASYADLQGRAIDAMNEDQA